MTLLIDIGNTATKFAKSNSSLEEVFVVPTVDVIKGLSSQNLEDVDKAFISSVVPEKSYDVRNFLEVKNIKSEFVEVSNEHGVIINIKNKNELGTDLFCDLVGAKSVSELPLLVIDLGTASKVLLLDTDSRFYSCAIIPGMELALNSLGTNTALIKKYGIDKPCKLLECNNTKDVVIASVIYSHIDSINGFVNRYEKETGKTLNKIITGGYAKNILDSLNFKFEYVPNLTLIGLNKIALEK